MIEAHPMADLIGLEISSHLVHMVELRKVVLLEGQVGRFL